MHTVTRCVLLAAKVIQYKFIYDPDPSRIRILGQNVIIYEINNFKLPLIKYKYFLRRLNASSRHFHYEYIVSQLKIVQYEISVYVCFVLDFFLHKYKKSEPKYEPELPYTNTEGLANIMRL